MVNKIKNRLNDFKNSKVFSVGRNAVMGTGMALLVPFSALANNNNSGDISVFADGKMTTEPNTDTLMNSLINKVLQIFQYIGALLLIWGIGQLVLAFKNDDADSKSRAMMVLVCSVMLIGLKTLYKAVMNIT